MAKIMVVAGGTWQCPIVRLAKSKGHYVICSNLYEDSPAFQYADAGVVADVLDKEKNLEIARQYRPDAVLTEQSDIAIPTVAYIAETLGLKGIGTETAARFTNKYLMREFLKDSSFALPGYRLCRSAQEAKDFLKEIGTGIIKPLDSQSSRGVHIVRSEEEIDRNFEDCIRYSNAQKAILLEEYIEGTEFTVDGLKTSGEYYVTAISEKEHFAYNPSVANRLMFSNENPKYDYELLRRVNTDMVHAMKLPFGLTHAEYKYRDGNFYLIEIAARGGGTKISSDIVPLISGINSNEVLINMLTGGPETVERREHYDYAVLGFLDFKPGLVTEIRGLEEAAALPGVHDFSLEVKVGDRLEQAQDDRSRCGYYIIYADTAAELEQREKALRSAIKVITDER